MKKKRVLHVGAGHPDNGATLPEVFLTPDWEEVRLDIDFLNHPDIIGSILGMGAVKDESVDAVYSSHNIEHIYFHEVPQALREFLRVLRSDGFLVITCPDLQSVCGYVVDDKLTNTIYDSPGGPISPIDILFGHSASLAAGHQFMAHKCGFTLTSLTAALQSAGFAMSAGKRRLSGLDLWVVATKGAINELAIRELAANVLPG